MKGRFFGVLGAVIATVLYVQGVEAQTLSVEPGREQLAATRQVQGFNIVLVLGETQPSSRVEATEDLPAAAQKALNDMREFLPYKHYRVLDAQWTSCCASLNSVLSGQLRGIAARRGGNEFMDQQYGFSLTVNSSSQGLSVRFALSDKALETARGADTDPGRAMALQLERAQLKDQIETTESQLADMEKKVRVGAVTTGDLRHLQDRYASLKRQYDALGRANDGSPAPLRSGIIDSSFIMQPGETVVVGTSRLGGDKALIALVTAAKKTGMVR